MDEEMRMWTEVCAASSADDPAAATAIQHTNKRSRIQADQETAGAAVSAAVSSRFAEPEQ
ncbi:hypothetical protein DAPPUDRAFT_238508 [Daphnia pulex]|uniref:Uncharacterized protein n=1 Tax=Daphnia pulex TaxID=6669 RepID=E9G6L3_DAPPU|nr:hypothetical protein DAPPUDRAFT_238508 [Daphnia pulex]|eukprot:EFX84954.1 hypothetical protein DAPPUDRAFT_238508 [Daphnia pulex]